MKKFKKVSLRILFALLLLYVVLLIPDGKSKGQIVLANQRSFEWHNDSVWMELEQTFNRTQLANEASLDSTIALISRKLEADLSKLKSGNVPVEDARLTDIQEGFFLLAPYVAARHNAIPAFIDFYNRYRVFIKQQSQHWDINAIATRNTIYTLLYGMRQAVEEVLLQNEKENYPAAMMVSEENSFTPSTTIFGIEVHSGDLLVSRGGAEVSALISRGNDYPGNFSHVALVYIEEKTNQPYLIEAHIEKGVAIASVQQYEQDKKLRFMVLRLRNDLPAMKADSMLPHKAAKQMYDMALSKHIPYDFKMNYKDSSALFCSEVASFGYKKNGVQLWQMVSTISSQGVVNWLNDFGVENFVTQMPSDLEYDPQLAVIAEWRDQQTLFKDHIDNAVMDALLEKANSGKEISYNIWQLPIVRLVKGYCMIKNLFGQPSLIPEGMSATQALKNQTFVAMHVTAKNKVEKLAADFTRENYYKPPYWQLVKFAQTAVSEK
ncbi:MAG: YiiX/YebB-like N1pC/P60 family cysteine hydrolase [Bacteroidota bacterium]